MVLQYTHLFPSQSSIQWTVLYKNTYFTVREGVCVGECLFERRFVYLVACSTDRINLRRHRLGAPVKKWKLRQVTTVDLGISIIFVMDFLASVSQSTLIASDERCYKSAKCYYNGGVFFFKERFFILFFFF